MGIGQAISRVKESVRKTGLDSLRSAAIPASLRPVATRLAELLRAPEAAPVVSLSQAISKNDAQAQMGASHEDLAAAGGVCPFSGMNAGLAGLLDASQFEGAAVSEGAGQESPLVPARDSDTKRSKPLALTAKTQRSHSANRDRAMPSKEHAPSGHAAPKRVVAKVGAKVGAKVSAKVAVKASAPSPAKAVAKAIAKPELPPKSKKSQPRAEKESEKVAARPATSKTPARSKDSATKSAAKRPTAKAVSKKN